MNLSKKIFLGIFIPSILFITIISIFLINNNFNNELNQEFDKNIRQFESIYELNFNSEYYVPLEILNMNKDFFKEKKIYFEYYIDNELVYNSSDFVMKNEKLLDIKEKEYYLIVEKHNDEHYVIISKMTDEGILIFKKSVQGIYDHKYENIRITLSLLIILSIILLFLAFIISKKVTKPLKKMEKEMKKISEGNYDVKLKEGKDEIGQLCKNFNSMSAKIFINNKKMLDNIESKQLFIDNLAHEMNTPLTSIKGYAEAIEKFDITEEQKIKYLQYIQKETDRIREMYKKLLFLSYKENTKVEFNKVNLCNIYELLTIELKDKLESKNINLTFSNNLIEFYGDEELIMIALSNLVRNAINNSNENTKILINSYEKENTNYLEVIDEGIGINKENITKILEPFYRVDKNRSRRDGGAGLGLSMVKKIMDLHKGNIYIESKINEGSKFILEFPKDLE